MEFLSRKHPAMYRHCVRVAILADKLADELALDDASKRALIIGSFLHDVGVGLFPSELWIPQAKLTSEQLNIRLLHAQAGADLMRSHSELGPEVLEIIRHHHEHYDGSGYPDGLAGEKIPYLARVCAVLDDFDRLVNDSFESGGQPCRVAQAREGIREGAGTRYDEAIVEAFMDIPVSVLQLYVLSPPV
ncbi:HD domain-containing phosphohydrolase [Gorillibacterium sp. CAU 1737]|uniref:HD-GYP domain-containing protein n=1 Tax=Gorillibacterium sp. CAU 1737 TaxID=3140362 RepID=UPI003261C2E6